MFEEIAKVKVSRDPRKKLKGVLQMAAMMASLEMHDITELTCQFVIKYRNKVNQCLLHHCTGNINDLLMSYPNFKHTTFKCTCEA